MSAPKMVCRIDGEVPDSNLRHRCDLAADPSLYEQEHYRLQIEEMAIQKFKDAYGVDVVITNVTWYHYPPLDSASLPE